MVTSRFVKRILEVTDIQWDETFNKLKNAKWDVKFDPTILCSLELPGQALYEGIAISILGLACLFLLLYSCLAAYCFRLGTQSIFVECINNVTECMIKNSCTEVDIKG